MVGKDGGCEGVGEDGVVCRILGERVRWGPVREGEVWMRVHVSGVVRQGGWQRERVFAERAVVMDSGVKETSME